MNGSSFRRPPPAAKLLAVLATCFALADRAGALDGQANWPQWRGPLGTGVAPDADPPIHWDETTNVRWKTELPGRGHSTPIVWEDRIFLTAAIPVGPQLPPRYSSRPGEHDNLPVTQQHRFVVLAIDRKNGAILWEKAVREALPIEGGHQTASLASASAVTDGQHVYAFFGSHGLYCLDFDGDVVWQMDFGQMHSKHGHGEGSSPALFGHTLIINWDHEGHSFVTALDKRDGSQLWKKQRAEVTSWATPIVVEHADRPQVVISGTGRVRGYDLQTGEVIWEAGGLSANIVASPVAGGGRVYAGSSYEKKSLLAISLDGAKGDITETRHILWTRIQRTPYVPSPLLYGNSLYYLRHYQGVLSRIDVRTGNDEQGPFRLTGIRDVYASPVGAANRIYITDRSGTTLVVSHDPRTQPLAVNSLDDVFNASAAIVGDQIFLRGERFLYCIGLP